MNEQRFRLLDDERRGLAMHAISEAPEGHEVIIKPFEKTRSTNQNSRYWASLTHYLKEINEIIERVREHTGYELPEIRREIARTMPTEHALILFAMKPEVAHDILKMICNVPTSTRLGTKAFMTFEETMERTIAEIAGEVKAFEGMANG